MQPSESVREMSLSQRPMSASEESLHIATNSLKPLHHLAQELSDHQQDVQDPVAQMPRLDRAGLLQEGSAPIDWLNYFQHSSRLLVAVIDPTTLTLQYANDYFYQLVGIAQPESETADNGVRDLGTALDQLLSAADNEAVQQLYRRHLLHLVLRRFYQMDLQGWRLLDKPVMISLHSPLYAEPRYIEFWLRSEQLTLTRMDAQLDEFAPLDLDQMTLAEMKHRLADPTQLQCLEEQLQLSNYQIEGQLLLEGIDVTEREIIRRITQLLIDRDSILQSQKFREVDQLMRSLFRAQNITIAGIEADQVRLFRGSVSEELDSKSYSFDSLQDSHFMESIRTNRVMIVPDLAEDCRNEDEHKVVELGIRSLLLIPLYSQVKREWAQAHPIDGAELQDPDHPFHYAIGMVGVFSDRPNSFDGLDYRHAEQLIPVFTAALMAAQRQLVQQRFITNIHPAVEWRFQREAERRSLGLRPEPIAFTEVYPLYGISDIRGSSVERNRAIQTDLLEQFRLGLAIVEASCMARETALGEQLRLDLLEHIRLLQEKVTVDAEVSGIRYLRDNLEIYFDYFSQCGEDSIAAIQAYQAACANPHGCVYQARETYDEVIGKINALLRETWDCWQVQMQRVTAHYCDIETTDGIDHMIYAGRSIDPKFSPFHLRSLRYEQLRAVCDCARTAFCLQEHYGTNLQVTHLVLVQDSTVDIFHDETAERLFDVRGSRDTRYEIVKKRIDKAVDAQTHERITQPGMLTVVYTTNEEWAEYQQYFRYLVREGWLADNLERGTVQPLQGVNGLKYVRAQVLAAADG